MDSHIVVVVVVVVAVVVALCLGHSCIDSHIVQNEVEGLQIHTNINIIITTVKKFFSEESTN